MSPKNREALAREITVRFRSQAHRGRGISLTLPTQADREAFPFNAADLAARLTLSLLKADHYRRREGISCEPRCLNPLATCRRVPRLKRILCLRNRGTLFPLRNPCVNSFG